MADHIYIKISDDKYEHIIAMGDTARELAEICNTNTNVIYSSISHNSGYYKKVKIESIE